MTSRSLIHLITWTISSKISIFGCSCVMVGDCISLLCLIEVAELR